MIKPLATLLVIPRDNLLKKINLRKPKKYIREMFQITRETNSVLNT